MEQDVITVCKPCFEMAQNFGITEWIGVGILTGFGAITFLTNKNVFSLAQGSWNVVKAIASMLKKK